MCRVFQSCLPALVIVGWAICGTATLAAERGDCRAIADGAAAMTTAPGADLLVWFKPAQGAAARALANTLGATAKPLVSGQGLYRITLPPGADRDRQRLLARVRSDPHVRRVTWNVPVTTGACPGTSDNHRLATRMRCGHAFIEYDFALPLFEAVLPYIALHEVHVAIIDTGLEAANGEFDKVRLYNLDNPGGELRDHAPRDDKPQHGTHVAGLIAADDDGAGINGIASRFLGDRLELMIGSHSFRADRFLERIDRAAASGADIVSISSSVTVSGAERRSYREAFTEIFASHPEILFVVNAGNDSDILTEDSRPPAGIRLDNVMTVGGSLRCDPTAFGIASNDGPLIDIMAPEEMPVTGLLDAHHPYLATGSSFSSPLVAAVAAVLKSMQPNLTPRDLRRLLQVWPVPNPPGTYAQPYLTYRLMMLRSIAQLLIEMDVGPPVSDWVGMPGMPVPLPSSAILANCCHYFNLSIAGVLEAVTEVGARIDMHGVVNRSSAANISGDMDAAGQVGVHMHLASDIRLDTYELVYRGPHAPPLERGQIDLGIPHVGDGVAGTVSFDECWITERHPTEHTPFDIAVSSELSGTFETRDGGQHAFEGNFDWLPVGIWPQHSDPGYHAYLDYLERTCIGGVERTIVGG